MGSGTLHNVSVKRQHHASDWQYAGPGTPRREQTRHAVSDDHDSDLRRLYRDQRQLLTTRLARVALATPAPKTRLAEPFIAINRVGGRTSAMDLILVLVRFLAAFMGMDKRVLVSAVCVRAYDEPVLVNFQVWLDTFHFGVSFNSRFLRPCQPATGSRAGDGLGS